MRRFFLAALALSFLGLGASAATNYFSNPLGVGNDLPVGWSRIASWLGSYGLIINNDGSLNARVTQPGCFGRHFNSAANTNATTVKTGAGAMCGAISLTNSSSTTAMYLRIYDSAMAPTCGSATGIIWAIQVPVNSTASNVAGIVVPLPDGGITFTQGLGFCLTGAIGDTDTSNAATGVTLNLGVR